MCRLKAERLAQRSHIFFERLPQQIVVTVCGEEQPRDTSADQIDFGFIAVGQQQQPAGAEVGQCHGVAGSVQVNGFAQHNRLLDALQIALTLQQKGAALPAVFVRLIQLPQQPVEGLAVGTRNHPDFRHLFKHNLLGIGIFTAVGVDKRQSMAAHRLPDILRRLFAGMVQGPDFIHFFLQEIVQEDHVKAGGLLRGFPEEDEAVFIDLFIESNAADNGVDFAVDQHLLAGEFSVHKTAVGIGVRQRHVFGDRFIGQRLQALQLLVVCEEIEIIDILFADAVGIAEETVADGVELVFVLRQIAADHLLIVLQAGGLRQHERGNHNDDLPLLMRCGFGAEQFAEQRDRAEQRNAVARAGIIFGDQPANDKGGVVGNAGVGLHLAR